MGHVLGLGRTNFDGDLMADKVNDGTEDVSECEIRVMLQANYWKLTACDIHPNWPEKIKFSTT
jgi:hypothetical protein